MSWTAKVLALAVLVLATGMAPAATNSDAEPFVLAVHPYLPVAEINRRFGPLANEIAAAIKRPVVVRVGRNYEEHVSAIGTDSVELAYLGPALYVTMVARYGGKPILGRQVVNGDPMLHGEIIVREDSPLHTLQDLKGRRFAFGDPQSTEGHVIPGAMLRAAGVPESALGAAAFLGSHRNVAIAVLAGDYDAGAVKEEVFEEFAPRGLRALASETPVPDHVFVASRKLPAETVETLRRLLLGLPSTARGMMILRGIHAGMSDLVPARDSDYDGLRRIMNAGPPKAR